MHCRIITELDSNPDKHVKDVIKTVTILDTVHLLSDAWDCVKEKTIQNCWRKGGFRHEQTNINSEDLGPLSDVPLPPNMDQETFDAIVDIDEDVPTVGELSEEELLREAAEIRSTKRIKLDNNNSGDHDEVDDEEEPAHVVTNSELVTSMNTMRTFTQQQGICASWVKEFFSNMEKEMLQNIHTKSKQTSIRDHFHS